MAPSIRFATEEDVPEILAIINELAEYEKAASSVQATEEKLLQTLSFPSNPNKGYAKTLLIFAPLSSSPSPDPSASSSFKTRPAGMALYFPNYSTWTAAPGIYLEDLFVRPQYRGKGYGKALLKRLAQEVVAMGGQRLDWSVLAWNKPSIEFYESIGAKKKEEWLGYRLEGEALESMGT